MLAFEFELGSFYMEVNLKLQFEFDLIVIRTEFM